jgi:hypothetical protein
MRFGIRCHPCAPVAIDEIEHWLEGETGRVRSEESGATVRLLRLSQDFPSGRHAMGWLIEFDAEAGSLDGERLAEIISEMRLLGLQPTVLEPIEHLQLPSRSSQRGPRADEDPGNGGRQVP